MTCTFFGHRDCPAYVVKLLEVATEKLITEHGVTSFLIGNNGNFDLYALQTVKKLEKSYPHIRYSIVSAYLSGKGKPDTILPPDIEKVHPKRAIPYRNEWMIDNSEYAITYVVHSSGGAARFAKLARSKNKICINLAE